MASYYWDPERGSNANSGTNPLSPVLDWNAAAIGSGTFAPGDILYVRAGSVYNAATRGRVAPAFSASPTAALPFVVTTYGDPALRWVIDGFGTRDVGFRPVASIDQANGPRYVTVENLEARNLTLHGVSIAEVLDTGVTDAYNTVRNCYIWNTTGPNNAAINIYGQGVRVERCIVDNVAGDGILIRGQGYCGQNVVSRVSNTGSGNGDAIQFDGGFSNSVIEWNVVDKALNRDKQAMLFVGTNSVMRFNSFEGLSIGSGLVTINQSSNVLFYGNTLEGTDGVFILDATGPCYVMGNVIIGTNPNASSADSTGIDVGTTFTHQHVITNNFVKNHNQGIFARNTFCRNNVVTGCGGNGINTSVGAANESFNYSWGNGQNFTAAPGTGSSTANMSQYIDDRGRLLVPDSATMANLASLNPLALAGTYVQGTHLFNGILRPGFVPVGAYQALLPRTLR
jgi:hypothetical protein